MSAATMRVALMYGQYQAVESRLELEYKLNRQVSVGIAVLTLGLIVRCSLLYLPYVHVSLQCHMQKSIGVVSGAAVPLSPSLLSLFSSLPLLHLWPVGLVFLFRSIGDADTELCSNVLIYCKNEKKNGNCKSLSWQCARCSVPLCL